MCRLAAYRGPALQLERLIHTGEHSLVTQSWACKELQGTSLNADGFGFGWYPDAAPECYTSTLPIWSDTNLDGLGKSLQAQHWAAYIRSATPGQPLSLDNTQPFKWRHYLFLHNGRIENFNDGPRQALQNFLHAEVAAEIQGNTDSEYLFALLKHFLLQDLSPQEAMLRANAQLTDLLGQTPAMSTLILLNGTEILCCRHAINGARCPTLYYTQNHSAFADGLLLASERFSETDNWETIAEHSCLHFKADNTLHHTAL
ncbi:MAG: class II glutamine amidotransferase [Gammaproteobacteria bacterium]